jgi:DNA-binding transcriptional ArsR family regulator
MIRPGDDDAGPRKFSAYGRDVDVRASFLRYEEERRRLTLAAEPPAAPDGTDLAPAARKLLEALDALGKPATARELVDWIAAKYNHGLKRPTVSTHLNAMTKAGLVDCLARPGYESLWSLRGVTVSADTPLTPDTP